MKLFKSNGKLSSLLTAIMIPVLVAGAILLVYRANNYMNMSEKIDSSNNQLAALNKLNRDVQFLKTKKDIRKRLNDPTFSLINRELLETAKIKNIRFLKYVSKARATNKRTNTNKLNKVKFNKEVDAVLIYLDVLKNQLDGQKYWARQDFNSIRKNIFKTVRDGKTSILRWKENTRELQSLKDRIEVTKIQNNYKRKLLKKLKEIIKLSTHVLNRLSNRRSAINAQNLLLIRANDLKVDLPGLIVETKAHVDSVYRGFYENALDDITKIGLLFICLIVLMYFKMMKGHSKDINKLHEQSEKHTDNAAYSIEQLDMLSNNSLVATAILDENENLVWSNKIFTSLFNLTNKATTSWKKIARNDVFDYSKETGVFGAVKLRSDLNSQYILKSNTATYDNRERRIIQIWSLEEYYLELAGKNNVITIPRESIPNQFSEIGNLLDELLIKMSVFFDNFRVDVDLKNKLPTLTTVNPEHLVLSLANVLKGLIFYLNHSRQGTDINISYNKINSKIVFKIEAVNSRIELSEIDRELKFNNKSYHSLGYYLTEGEEFLENYGAKIGVL